VLKSYAKRIRDARRAHTSITEPGLAPEFQQFLVEILAQLPAAPELTVLAEFINSGIGRPDLALKRAGEQARAFIELKAIDKLTDGSRWTIPHDKRQFARFAEFPVWATCNFYEIRLYERAESKGNAALVPEEALDPSQSDAAADTLIDAHDPSAALRLIERLAQSDPPSAKDAEHLAELLAHSARLVRGIIRDRLAELTMEGKTDTPLHQVRQEFRDVLYSHPEAAGYSSSDFDELFSAAFAQTLAFGLLLVREATGGAVVDNHAYEQMPDEHPLMRTTLRVLSLPEVAQEVGAGFEVMLQTVNGFDPKILGIRKDGSDPILYFYENFLSTFDPAAREKYGVYYTPTEVVRFMVGALDRALRDHLKTDGIADGKVHILDPAAGTGTFLLGVADRLRRNVTETHGPGQAPAALRGLAQRMYGFELLIGPYAVAHYRLHHALSRKPDGTADKTLKLPRLGVYLTDTLAQPGTAAALGSLGFVSDGIRDERTLSDRVKSQQEILAIIGNPPYRRLEVGENDTLVGRWMDDKWTDLKKPVSDAGQGNQLNTFPELSIAFWRWSIWKMFESENAPGRGVIAFISNRKYLTGWPYAGLRKMMRERFDRIEIIDLRGDVRRGVRGDIERDQGVFSIQVGTCITLAIADGSKAEGAMADVIYNDAWMHDRMSRRAKLHWMLEGEEAGTLSDSVSVDRGALEDMRPRPFMNGDLISLREAFYFTKSGMKSGNDPALVSFTREKLRTCVTEFIKDHLHSTYNDNLETEYAYRPLDRRWFYNDAKLLNRRGPEMQRVWGSNNVGMYALPAATGEGPSVWCHGLLPDYHALKGSNGGYVFALYDRRPGHGPYNLKSDLIAALELAYGSTVEAEAVFDVILCLLSATSYTTRFAEDLEDVFPHVPFPASRTVFDEAAKVGSEIRALETFARAPAASVMKGLAMNETAATGPLAPVNYENGAIALCADGSGRITGIPEPVWSFSVSGYRVFQRWIAAREGQVIEDTFVPQLRDVAGRIAELIDLFAAADSILTRTLADSLSRTALSLTVLDAAPVELALADE
jgi:hypothetical protein